MIEHDLRQVDGLQLHNSMGRLGTNDEGEDRQEENVERDSPARPGRRWQTAKVAAAAGRNHKCLSERISFDGRPGERIV